MNYDKIGEFIQKKRKEKNLTQKELANIIGVTDKAVSKWERGLGCPDVSILEILADTLGVSILEILKGRIIENKIIKVTEVNDYVKETINYSNELNKRKLKQIISNIIAFIIVFISILLVILNIINIYNLNYKEEYNFNNEVVKRMENNYNEIENNIKTIKNNQGIFNDDDYKKIILDIDNRLRELRNIKILKYKGIKKFDIRDLYILDLDYPRLTNEIDIYNILIKYDSSINDYLNIYKDIFVLNAMMGNDTYLEPDLMYRYKIMNIPDTITFIEPSTYKVQSRIMAYNYMIDSYLYLTKKIIEVGEINE